LNSFFPYFSPPVYFFQSCLLSACALCSYARNFVRIFIQEDDIATGRALLSRVFTKFGIRFTRN
jgi:hypothetical protein